MATIDVSNRIIQRGTYEHPYTSDCFVNPDTYDFYRSVWGGRIPEAFVIHNAGFIVAIVFPEYYAYSEQDALDEAADSGKLDFLQITDTELPDYQTGTDSEGFPEYEGIINLGNASEPFDQENLNFFTVPVSLFRSDSVIVDVIAKASRDDAIELLLDARDNEYIAPETDGMDGWNTLSHAINYLRQE